MKPIMYMFSSLPKELRKRFSDIPLNYPVLCLEDEDSAQNIDIYFMDTKMKPWYISASIEEFTSIINSTQFCTEISMVIGRRIMLDLSSIYSHLKNAGIVERYDTCRKMAAGLKQYV